MSPPETSVPLTWFRRLGRPATFSAAIYLTATVLSRAGAIFLIPIYTRRLNLEEYGDLGLASTIVAVLPTFLSFGLLSALARFYYDDSDVAAARRRVGGVARWMLTLTLFTSGALQLVILALPLPQTTGIEGPYALTCLLWASAGAALAGIPSVYLRTAQRPLGAAVFQLIQFFSLALAGIGLVAELDRGLQGAFEAMLFANALSGLVSIAFVLVALDGPMTRQVLVAATRFSIPFIPHFAANQLQQVADRWMLKGAGLQDQLGAFSLAGQVASPTSMVLVAWNDASSPQMGEVKRTEGLVGLRRVLGRFERSFLLSAAVPGLLITLALPLAATVVGPAFEGALLFVPGLLAISLLESLYFPNSNAVFFADRPNLIPKITIVAGILNLVLNGVLIGTMGVLGALLARALSMGFRSLAMRVAAYRLLPET